MQCGETNQQCPPPPPGASLPPDMLANIHGRLSLLDRLSFAAVFHTSRAAFRPEAPWLVLPGDTRETATLFSLSDRGAATARAQWADHVVLGSTSRCWLVTADDEARLRLVNPVTGERCALPAITTIPGLIEKWGGFTMVDQKEFLRGPPYPGGGDRRPVGTYTIRADLMRHFFYRKVVVSDCAAMLITTPQLGVPAFATAEGGEWRLAPSRDGVEDAIHYNGKFYSITYKSGVEVWEQSPDATGMFTSAVVAPRLPNADGDPWSCRKYLVAAPGGRLMVVLEDSKEIRDEYYGRLIRTCSFKVQILDADGEQWKETDDIGDAALFVGVNSSMCVSTREHPEIRAGCVYYTKNDVGPCNDAYDQSGVGVFNLKDGRAEKVQGLGQHRNWPPPAWFIPSIQ
ncbi:F-box protein At2g17036-like [Aegilops tauschii subsp. strangulata]|nr:uncharacterized protein LOC109749597 [Aegilops tauschii subsp. strangulata]